MRWIIAGWEWEAQSSFLTNLREVRFARGANAHLIDDETVAKMGHPSVVVRSDVGHPS